MAERLSNDLLRIWQSGEFSDVTLVCSDGGRVEAHKQILASRSHYFARMMFGKMKEGGEREVVLQAKEKPLRLLLTHLYSNQVALEEEQVAPVQKTRPRKSTTTLSRGPGTFRKSGTYVCKDLVKPKSGGVSREDLISYLDQEGLLEEEEHRREVLALLTDYAKKVRKQQMDLVLANPVLDDPEVMEEAVNLMQDFVRRKKL